MYQNHDSSFLLSRHVKRRRLADWDKSTGWDAATALYRGYGTFLHFAKDLTDLDGVQI